MPTAIMLWESWAIDEAKAPCFNQKPVTSPSPIFPVARCLVTTVERPPPEVFDAALNAAERLGMGVSLADRKALHLLLDTASRRRRTSNLEVSITDNGLGATAMHICWESSVTAGRRAARLNRRIVARCSGEHGRGA